MMSNTSRLILTYYLDQNTRYCLFFLVIDVGCLNLRILICLISPIYIHTISSLDAVGRTQTFNPFLVNEFEFEGGHRNHFDIYSTRNGMKLHRFKL